MSLVRSQQRRSLLALVCALLLVGVAGACSLTAPSDAELMGGAKDASADGDAAPGEGGAGDASDDANGADADTDAACLPTGFFCNGVPTRCCSGACTLAGGKKCD